MRLIIQRAAKPDLIVVPEIRVPKKPRKISCCKRLKRQLHQVIKHLEEKLDDD